MGCNVISRFALAVLLAVGTGADRSPVVRTVAGGSQDEGTPAATARLQSVGGLAVDPEGNVYFSDRDRNLVRRIDARTGLLSTVAGTGKRGSSGDGGPAREADLASPSFLALDRRGYLYVETSSNPRIRRIDLRSATIETMLEVPALESIAVGPGGDLYLLGRGIERVSARTRESSNIADWSTVGPTLLAGGQGSMVNQGSFAFIAIGPGGDVYVADGARNQISVFRSGRREAVVLAGNGEPGSSKYETVTGDAALSGPGPLVVDAKGTVYFCESALSRVRALDWRTGRLNTVAGRGNGVPYSVSTGENRVANIYAPDPLAIGDGGPATASHLPSPHALALDERGHLFIADGGNRIRNVDLKTGLIRTIAGATARNPGGDGGPATAAALNGPFGVAVSPSGDLYIAERGNRLVRVVDGGTGIIRTLPIGGLNPGMGFQKLTFDRTGSLFGIEEYGGIFRIELPTGATKRVAGRSQGARELGAALATSIQPGDIAFDAAGHGYFSDPRHQIIRLDLESGQLTAVAGTGVPGFSGDGGLAKRAQLNEPRGIVLDSAGSIYFSDRGNRRVRRIDASTGVITTVAGNGEPGFSGDGGLAVRETLEAPGSLAIDQDRYLFIDDEGSRRIRRLDLSSGILTTTVGNGQYAARVESGLPGNETALAGNYYGALAVAADGTLYFSSVNDGIVFGILTREGGGR